MLVVVRQCRWNNELEAERLYGIPYITPTRRNWQMGPKRSKQSRDSLSCLEAHYAWRWKQPTVKILEKVDEATILTDIIRTTRAVILATSIASNAYIVILREVTIATPAILRIATITSFPVMEPMEISRSLTVVSSLVFDPDEIWRMKDERVNDRQWMELGMYVSLNERDEMYAMYGFQKVEREGGGVSMSLKNKCVTRSTWIHRAHTHKQRESGSPLSYKL